MRLIIALDDRGTNGFTFAEVLLIFALIAILTAIGIPSYKKMQARLAVRNAAFLMKSTLYLARTRAVSNPRKHVGVHFSCFSSPQKLIVFLDDSISGVPPNNKYDAAGDRLYQTPVDLPRGVSINFLTVTDSCVLYRGDGSTQNVTTFEVSSVDGNHKKTITINRNSGTIEVGS